MSPREFLAQSGGARKASEGRKEGRKEGSGMERRQWAPLRCLEIDVTETERERERERETERERRRGRTRGD